MCNFYTLLPLISGNNVVFIKLDRVLLIDFLLNYSTSTSFVFISCRIDNSSGDNW